VGKPTLWRYYGLSGLVFLALFGGFFLDLIAKRHQLEWFLKWGSDGINPLCVGFCLILRGLDFVILRKRYPSFLRENAPSWDARAQWMGPVRLLWQGIIAILGGVVIACIGGRNLINDLQVISPR
jgi:hypothetical protein